MSLLEKTKYLLQTYQIRPKKSLGQNFMIEPAFFSNMTDCASLSGNETVLDIGAGVGLLTRFVANRCNTVLAVEADKAIAGLLREQLSDMSNVKIIEGDVLRTEIPPFDKVISIPPYNISSHLLLWLFSRKFDSAVFIFQREFANRLVAPPGNEEYGSLTVISHHYMKVELLGHVPKSAFYPQPKVVSVIVSLKPSENKPFVLKDEASFRNFVQSLFTQRNRKVRNAVLPYLRRAYSLSKETAVKTAEALPFHDRRVRELTPENFGVLANALVD
jgi:16S rRNA (adenine1518-N6/adenine1519-N6)-dimethyltransferase